MIRIVAIGRTAIAPRVLLAGALGVALVASAVSVPADPAADRVHTVGRGDTLYGLARRYGVPVGALVTANHLASDRVPLRVGQRLVVPSASVAPSRALARSPRGGVGDPGPRTRTVRAPIDFVLAVPDFADALAVFQWPADGAVSSVFGHRRSGWHRGIDIRAAHGEPIQASAAGVVVVSGVEPRYGRVLKIEHEYGFTTVYAHNDENLVKVGDWVTPGQRIARVGRTGRATNYHVHFEIRRDGHVYNPLYMLPMPGGVVAHVDETGEEPDE
jgi:murein DD-endopeptidase MepM/ murein hydrolase activator NlpD